MLARPFFLRSEAGECGEGCGGETGGGEGVGWGGGMRQKGMGGDCGTRKQLPDINDQ